MECDEIRDQLPDYLRHDLNDRVRQMVDAHLAECQSCAGLKAIGLRLLDIPVEEPSAGLERRFDAMLDAFRAGQDVPRSSWWTSVNAWMDGWWPRQPVLQAGLALALLAIGLAAGRAVPAAPVPQQPSTPEITRLQEEVRDMRQMVALALLQQQSAVERLRGVTWTSQIERPNDQMLAALIDTLKYDASVNVRLAAIDALKPFAAAKPTVRQGFVDALLRQDSPMVQVALIDLFVELRDRQSVDVLKLVKDDEKTNTTVRERAGWGIAQLN